MSTAQDQQIAEARKILGLQEVRLGKVPLWLFKRLAAYRKTHGILASPFRDMLLQDVAAHVSTSIRWLDHWGTAKGGPYHCCGTADVNFISEPYEVTAETTRILDAFCKPMGLMWHVSPDSWWYPGHTLRITIHPETPCSSASPDESDE